MSFKPGQREHSDHWKRIIETMYSSFDFWKERGTPPGFIRSWSTMTDEERNELRRTHESPSGDKDAA